MRIAHREREFLSALAKWPRGEAKSPYRPTMNHHLWDRVRRRALEKGLIVLEPVRDTQGHCLFHVVRLTDRGKEAIG